MRDWIEVPSGEKSYYWEPNSGTVDWDLPAGDRARWLHLSDQGLYYDRVTGEHLKDVRKPTCASPVQASTAPAASTPSTVSWLGGLESSLPAETAGGGGERSGGPDRRGAQPSAEPKPHLQPLAAATARPLARQADGDANGGQAGYPSEHVTPAVAAAASTAPPGVPQIFRSAAPAGTRDTWSERIQFLARQERTGLHLCSLAWEWEKKWPNDKFEDFRPCKKMKDSVLRYVPGVVVVNDNLWACETLPADDALHKPSELSAAEARSARIFAMSKPERQGLRRAFDEAGWTQWSTAYHEVRQDPQLFRCTLRCRLPAAALEAAGRVGAASSGSSPLAGTWTYVHGGRSLEYDIVEQGPRLLFSEVMDNGVQVSGELLQADDGWREAQMANGLVRVRWRGEGTIESQCRVSAEEEWAEAIVASRSTHGTYVGYGPGPLMSAISAMEEAMKDPRLPPPAAPQDPPPPVAAWWSPAPPAPAGCSGGAKPTQSPFALVDKNLEALLRFLTDARLRPQPAAATGAEDEQEAVREGVAERFATLVDGVCSLLVGEKAVPLTETVWLVSKVLRQTWHYALALRDRDAVHRLGRALQEARRALLVGPEEAALPEAGCVGVPSGVWEDLLDASVRAVQPDTGVAEEALAWLPERLPPSGARYSAHFLQLLQHERAAELRAGMAEAEAALLAQQRPPVFEGAWSREMLHRPDIDLALVPVPGVEAPCDWGYLRKGEVVLLTPWPPRRGLGALVELRTDFDACRGRNEGEQLPILKVKLYSVQLPLGAIAELLGAQTFAVAPVRATKVPHERQAEAVKAVCRSSGSCYHNSIRGLVLRSWALHGPRPAAYGLREPAPAQQEEPGGPAPRDLAAELPEDLEVQAGRASLGSSCSVPLTPGQEQAVHLAASRRCTLVRGPPGTGKTHTACAIIGRWCETVRRCRVLVVTQSNAAALNIHQRLEAFGLPSVRVGMQLKPEELLRQRYFCDLFEPADLAPLREAVTTGEPPPPTAATTLCQRAAKRAPVVVMTCISSGNMSLLGGCSFQRVLLDEAAQATEPTSLVPLMSGAPAFACIGDDRQLPATVKTQVAKGGGLDESLFERLLRAGAVGGDGFVQLDAQRRMHSSIADFPACRFYGSCLANGVHDGDRPPVPGIPWPRNGACRVLFVDLAGRHGREEMSGTSTLNKGEAELLVKTLLHFLQVRESGAVKADDVAVITGYAAQRDYIRQEIAWNTRRVDPARSVRIDTVDGFQGMERELVLVSSTRSNSQSEVGFLKDPRRTNVLLTRARRGLIVFGDAQTLKSEEEVWGPWLSWVEAHGGFVDAQGLQQGLQARFQAVAPGAALFDV